MSFKFFDLFFDITNDFSFFKILPVQLVFIEALNSEMSQFFKTFFKVLSDFMNNETLTLLKGSVLDKLECFSFIPKAVLFFEIWQPKVSIVISVRVRISENHLFDLAFSKYLFLIFPVVLSSIKIWLFSSKQQPISSLSISGITKIISDSLSGKTEETINSFFIFFLSA